MNDDMLYLIHMLHVCADRWEKTPSEVFRILIETNCIDGLIIPYGEQLRTQSAEYASDEIREFILSRGVEV